jgi:hypothetical protein
MIDDIFAPTTLGRDPPRLIHRGSRKASIEAHSHDQRARAR